MRVGYLGNFEPPHSTENEVRRAWEGLGAEVVLFQESNPDVWLQVPDMLECVDLLLWTRTGWNPPISPELQERAVNAAKERNIPVVGYHLDIWFGLHREPETGEPFFRQVDLLCTADGGHQAEWERIGVDHVWFPPAVGDAEAARIGQYDPRFAECPIAFLGSWDGGYHPEWRHRHDLVAYLQRRGDVSFWPKLGEHAVRLQPLVDLYTTVPITVGDSCDIHRNGYYWSDRIPECLGRGGFLIHPYVKGLDEHFTPGEHLECWEIGDWGELDRLITFYLDNPEERGRIAARGKQHVLENHTYSIRMRQLTQLLTEREMLDETNIH